MEKLYLYNTLSRKKEEFKPIKRNKVGFYACGPTVYDFAHIGNLRTYIFEDILKRVLVYNGYKVKHIENITDVGHLASDADEGEDKMMKAINREGLKPNKESLLKLAEIYTEAFRKDINALNISEPTKWVKATGHIKEMVELIKRIEKNGYTYETEDGLYFDTTKIADYGKLANLQNVELKAGARVDLGSKKKSTDFVLWIKAVSENKNHVMVWPSPWGMGFPGWHIECSAMSIKYLGEHFDIHAGGIDHIAVHHSNEIAQNEGATGKKSVNFWLHGEFLILDSGRMGKSVGNFITLQTLIEKGFNPLAYRYLCLQTHWRQKLTFSYEALQAAQNALIELRNQVRPLSGKGKIIKPYQEEFNKVINDDLNMPKALALIWDLLKSKEEPQDKLKTILDFDKVLGLSLNDILDIPKEVIQFADERQKARNSKDWQKSDELRKKIDQLGYLVEDAVDSYVIKAKK